MKKYYSGFTLIELVIYIGILALLLGMLSSIFTSIIDVQLESTATSSVNQDGRYILAKLTNDFQANNPVSLKDPTVPGSTSASLRININNNIVDTTYAVANGKLTRTDSQGTDAINSYDTSVSNFKTTRIGLGGADTVQVSFTLTGLTKERSGYETKTFQSTFTATN